MRRFVVALVVIGVVLLGACTPPATLPRVETPPTTPSPAPAPLTAPRLVTPHNGATGVELTASLVWQPVPNAGGYELVIAHNYDFSDIYWDVSTRLTGYQFIKGFEPSAQYYWMVVAKMNLADPNTPVAYSEVWTFTTAPTPPPIPREEVFPKVMERVVSLAQTPEAKEYVSIIFPPYAYTSEYHEELRAWATTITTLRPDVCERMESFDWCLVDCEKHFETLFRGDRWSGYWLVYDDSTILPVGWALVIEADIERLNRDRTLTTSAVAPEPAHTPPTTLAPDPWPWFHSSLSSSDIAREPLRYDGRGIVISGQTYLEGSGPRLLVDGKSGVNIAGNTAGLQRGFYRLMGEYDADTNTLNVTGFDWEPAKYLAIEAGKELDINLVPVSVQGLIATTPKEVASMLASYISIPHFPKDIPIYPYMVYTKDGLYLALSDTPVHLPSEFTFLYEGRDYGFTFSAGEVKGTLVKTPLKEINFGPKWEPDEFGGVIIAHSISSFAPLNTTVEQVNTEPDKYAFHRVSVTASYLVTTATLDYSDIKAPMGQGVLAETFTDFFGEDSKKRLETIDPERKVWQLRECQVTGTVIYPTEEILKYLDYSAPLSKPEVIEMLKPVLIVDTLVDEEVEVVNISELNPIVGDPSRYWGKVVQFEGYALGINYPLQTLVKTVTGRDIPLNVNLLAVGIADKPAVGSQIAIIGLNNDMIDEQGEIIKGKYKFKVAVSHMPELLVSGLPYADTALFLLSKEELPIEVTPLELYTLHVFVDPSEAGKVVPLGGEFASGTVVILRAWCAPGYKFDHWSGHASGTSPTITITMDSDKSITAHFKLFSH